MAIWAITSSALSGLGIPVAAGHYVDASGDLPDQYVVYRLISDPAAQHADDEETLRSYRMQVSAYSRTGLETLPDIDAAMLAAGFTRAGGGELPYNEGTRHYGRYTDYFYLEDRS